MTKDQRAIIDLISNVTFFVNLAWWLCVLFRHMLVKHTRPWWSLNTIVVLWRPAVRWTILISFTLSGLEVLFGKHYLVAKFIGVAAYCWIGRMWWKDISRFLEEEDDDEPWNKIKSWVKKHLTVKVLKPVTVGR